ncbi:MAG: TetR/AcrR family transcriptional regulator [Saprospiraceae bacterium]|nr:TetR/AcrR family transcriptional regulator [Saprospiraceae bacterium]
MKKTIERDERGYLIMPDELLEKCAEHFMKIGVRSVSMDDISRHLGISKKTLYQYVSNKGELLAKIIRLKVVHVERDLSAIFSGSSTALTAFMDYSTYPLDSYGWINPKAVYDLKKYYPTAWKIYQDHLEVFTYTIIEANLSRGIKEGLFRKSLCTPVITSIYLRTIVGLFNSNEYPLEKFTPAQVMKDYLCYHLHGICTEKGVKIITAACKEKA